MIAKKKKKKFRKFRKPEGGSPAPPPPAAARFSAEKRTCLDTRNGSEDAGPRPRRATGLLSWLHQDTAKSLHLNWAGRAHGRGREPWGPAPPICKRGLRAVPTTEGSSADSERKAPLCTGLGADLGPAGVLHARAPAGSATLVPHLDPELSATCPVQRPTRRSPFFSSDDTAAVPGPRGAEIASGKSSSERVRPSSSDPERV